MKTISFQRRNALLSRRGISLGALLILLAATVISLRVFFPGAFIVVAAPALRAGAALSGFAADVRAQFDESVAVSRERDALRSENAALESENAALAARADDLVSLLGTTPNPPQGIVAGILLRPPESAYDTVIVGAGSTSGVSPGMRALTAGGVPIGEVESVTAGAARVVLYSSSGHARSAWVGKSRVPVTLTGQGAGAFGATAPRDAGIATGDIVYIGVGSLEPIGRIRAVTDDPASPTATLFITPSVNLFSLTWVTLAP